jgi:outer membrane protein W
MRLSINEAAAALAGAGSTQQAGAATAGAALVTAETANVVGNAQLCAADTGSSSSSVPQTAEECTTPGSTITH